jgi:ATP synthase protein I
VFDATDPRPLRAADLRGEQRLSSAPSLSDERRTDDWRDDEPPVRVWSRAEVADLRRRKPSLSPWRVVVWQLAVAALGAVVAQLVTGVAAVAASAFYGGMVVAVPGALMARAATRDVTGVHPAVGALSLLAFQALKLLATLGLLAIAPLLIGELHWPALLATLAIGLSTYWVALAVRPPAPASAHPA